MMNSVLAVSAAMLSLAFPVLGAAIDMRAANPYAPQPTTCPSGPLVRSAQSISPQESSYVSSRAPKAAAALQSWLGKIDSTYSNASKVPTVALTHSGGGYRSLLISAGVVQAMDARDGSGPLAGLLQGITYQGGLSGGSWFLSSLYGNNYPTISSLQKNLWTDAFAESLFLSELFSFSAEGNVATDVVAKKAAGYDVGLVDPYGRLLGYQFFEGPDGGVDNTLSGIASGVNFTNFDVPFPILTSTGVDTFAGQCGPTTNSTIYEFTPYEFGSWGPGIKAFSPTQILGSNITNGQATSCIKGYDNLGFVLGTSSDLFFEVVTDLHACSANTSLASSQGTSDSGLSSIISELEGILGKVVQGTVGTSVYASYPNPFKGYAGASEVSQAATLSLVDGGASGQNVPINPFIQPARAVDVLIMADSSSNTAGNLPNGSDVHTTYLSTLPQNLDLPKMPEVPDADTFVAKGLNTHPAAFGCDDAAKTTLIYLPNYNYTYQDAGEPTFKLEYLPGETDAMIKNGNAVATRNDDKQWPACMACIVMKKTGETLPDDCQSCFEEYCFN